jgi:hypothetical protein
MRKCLLTLVILALPVSAADFRVVDFGASCDSIRDLEKATGSREASWPGLSPDVPGFIGQLFDREVTITYFCYHGKFTVGNYFFAWQSPDDAVQTFHYAYDKLVLENGAPYTDLTPWRVSASRSISIQPNILKYRADWLNERVHTTILLRASDDGSPAKWQVTILQRLRTF